MTTNLSLNEEYILASTVSEEVEIWRKRCVFLRRRRDKLLKIIKSLKAMVNEQAEDDGIWFIATSASEAYLQQELRALHAEIEKWNEE